MIGFKVPPKPTVLESQKQKMHGQYSVKLIFIPSALS